MTIMHLIKVAAAAVAIGVAPFGVAVAQDIPAPPAAGVSAKVDAIRAAGALRVAVQTRGPWLLENTTGEGEPWTGPAWTLGKTVAEALGVQLALVPVSEETKVPVLAANQADITLSPLAETPERLAIIDFVLLFEQRDLHVRPG